jgi:hypothetical protein
MRRAILISVHLALAAVTAGAQTNDSTDIGRTVEEHLPACKGASNETPHRIGYCRGVVSALLDFISMQLLRPDEWKVCIPMGTTHDHVLAAVTQYVEQRPDEMHNDFVEVALKAIEKTWPCPIRP